MTAYIQTRLQDVIAHSRDKVIVRTAEQFQYMLKFLDFSPFLTADFETSGLMYYRHARPCGIALGGRVDDQYRFFYVPYRHKTGESQLSLNIIGPALKGLLENNKLKIFHKIKFDEHMALREGWQILGPRYDTMVAARLFNENESAALKHRAIIDLNIQDAASQSDIVDNEIARIASFNKMKIKEYKNSYGYSQLFIDICGLYACYDVYYTTLLYEFYESKGISQIYSQVFNTEMALTRVLCDMEENGMKIDTEYLSNLKAEFKLQKYNLENAIRQLIPVNCQGMNLGSDDDILNLINSLGFGDKLTKRTKKQKLSVDKEVLGSLSEANPVFQYILDWREIEKLDSTYTDSVLARMDENLVLHCDFQSVGTRTGRLSCRRPNLQNQPSDSNDRAEKFSGKKLSDGGIDPWSIRRAYTVPGEGWKRLYFDYSQIELRVLAFYSKDPVMVDAYMTGQDIHDRTSLEVFGNTEKHLRRLAKIINFGLSYGMQSKGFSRQAGIPIEDAERHLSTFFQRYAGVKMFRDNFWGSIAQSNGYFVNLFGRPNHFSNITSINPYKRGEAKRGAIASLIQGTAAELTKESLVRIYNWIHMSGYQEVVKLVCTVHDEIQIDVHDSVVSIVAYHVKRLMEDYPQFAPLPIITGVEITDTNWSDKKEYVFET